MRILAIDGSSGTTCIAVCDDGVVLGASESGDAPAATRQILGQLERVLRAARVTLDTLDALAIGRGPGSFTGLRASFATMRGLQLATGLPLFGVCSLRATAESAGIAGRPVLACIDARRDELFAQGFSDDGSSWMPLTHAPAETVGRLAASALPGGTIALAGALPAGAIERLVQVDRSRFAIARPERTAAIAVCVARAAAAGDAERDDGSMDPRYVRPPDAKLPEVRGA